MPANLKYCKPKSTSTFNEKGRIVQVNMPKNIQSYIKDIQKKIGSAAYTERLIEELKDGYQVQDELRSYILHRERIIITLARYMMKQYLIGYKLDEYKREAYNVLHEEHQRNGGNVNFPQLQF
jgi:hypothetical protein